MRKDKKKKALKIFDMEIDEISLVDKAATGGKFHITKKDAQDLTADLKEFLLGEKEKDLLLELADRLPDDVKAALQPHVKALKDIQDDFPPDLGSALMELTKRAFLAAESGPDPQNDEALAEIQETAEIYADDVPPDVKDAFGFLAKMAADGLPNVNYKDPEEDEGPADYVSKYPSSYMPGDHVRNPAELQLEKSENPLFPSIQIPEEESSIFKNDDEEDPEDEEDELTAAEKILKLEAEVKKLKRPHSRQPMGLEKDLYPEDLEELEKSESEFQWSSLLSD